MRIGWVTVDLGRDKPHLLIPEYSKKTPAAEVNAGVEKYTMAYWKRRVWRKGEIDVTR